MVPRWRGGSLLPCHGYLTRRSLHFLGLLHECTQRAKTDHQQIVEGGARYAFLLSNLAPDFERREDVDDGADVGETASEATFADGLGILAKLVARDKVGDNAQPQIVEAAEKSVLPVSRHFFFFFGKRFTAKTSRKENVALEKQYTPESCKPAICVERRVFLSSVSQPGARGLGRGDTHAHSESVT